LIDPSLGTRSANVNAAFARCGTGGKENIFYRISVKIAPRARATARIRISLVRSFVQERSSSFPIRAFSIADLPRFPSIRAIGPFCTIDVVPRKRSVPEARWTTMTMTKMTRWIIVDCSYRIDVFTAKWSDGPSGSLSRTSEPLLPASASSVWPPLPCCNTRK